MSENFFNRLFNRQSNEIPFKGALKDSKISKYNVNSKFTEIISNPDKIVRVESFEQLKDRYEDKINPIELANIANKLFKELEIDYEISAPVDFLVGKDEKSNNVVYSVVDKIDGKNLTDRNIEVSSEVIKQVQKLYESIAKYFFDKLQQDGFYLTDIENGSQYVFGKKKGEQKEKIHLIDTDIYLDNNKITIYTIVAWLTIHISSLEGRFNTKFEKARWYVDKFINQPLPKGIREPVKEKINNNIIGIKKFLSGGKLDPGPIPAIPKFE